MPPLDMGALMRELAAEAWTEEALLVTVLRQFGARDLRAEPPRAAAESQAGPPQGATFCLPDLGIPWGKVAYVLGQDAVKEQAGASSCEEVTAEAEVSELPGEGVLVGTTFELGHLGLAMEFRSVFDPGRYSFSARVRKMGRGGILDNAIVWRFMRAGFMGAARRFAQACLSELRLRAEREGEGQGRQPAR